MLIAVAGSGAREDALVRQFTRQGHKAVAVPGNAGMNLAHVYQGDLEQFVIQCRPDLVVFGPEQPLVAGEADKLRARGIPVFGPGADGARIEGSKAFMKMLARKAGLATAAYQVFLASQIAEAQVYAQELIGRFGRAVIKTDYLAAGKGVLVTGDVRESDADIRAKLTPTDKVPHPAIVIEEALEGPEISIFAICDGHNSVCLPAAQDYKPFDATPGSPNTGGMGAWSPLPFLEAYKQLHYPSEILTFEEIINRDFVQLTLMATQSMGIDYRGVLYAGLILTDDGPKLLEYNIRFGDPDSQVVLLRMTSDLAELVLAAANGDLNSVPAPTCNDETAVLVVGAADGYPNSPRMGDIITGLDEARSLPQSKVLTAGVAEQDGKQVTAGGRVVNTIGFGSDATEARTHAYAALDCIEWQDKRSRDDIAIPEGV